MGTDYSFHKLKKGVKKVYPIFGDGHYDDYEEVAYFSKGYYIQKLLDLDNSKAYDRYTEDEKEMLHEECQVPVCLEDVRKAIKALEELDERVKSMPYDRNVDFPEKGRHTDNVRSFCCRKSDFKSFLESKGLSEDDVLSKYEFDGDVDFQCVSAKTQNMKDIIREVYRVYDLIEYHFAYPWDIDDDCEFKKRWKYSESELGEFRKLERIFLEEHDAHIFMTWG